MAAVAEDCELFAELGRTLERTPFAELTVEAVLDACAETTLLQKLVGGLPERHSLHDCPRPPHVPCPSRALRTAPPVFARLPGGGGWQPRSCGRPLFAELEFDQNATAFN